MDELCRLASVAINSAEARAVQLQSPPSSDPATAAAAAAASGPADTGTVFLPVWNDRRKKERPRRGGGGGGGVENGEERGWEGAVGWVGGAEQAEEVPPRHRLSSDHEPPQEALGVKVSRTAW